jgi:hypothetical protein
MKPSKPKFFSNTADDAHCLHASVKMALASASPSRNFSFPELFALSGNSGQALTWPLRTAATLASSGYKIAYIDPLDLQSFIHDPVQTMTEVYGSEVAEAQVRGSDIEQVVDDARLLLSRNASMLSFRVPAIDDLISLIQAGYYCICNVNAKALDDREGYAGHFVLLYDWYSNEREFVVHNPGLPAQEEMQISEQRFLAAWSYPTDVYRNILAIHSRDNQPDSDQRLSEIVEGYRIAFKAWLHQSHSNP